LNALRTFAEGLGPRSGALLREATAAADAAAALAAGFAPEDAVLQVLYPRAQNDRELLGEFLRYMQPEIERIGDLAIQPRLRGRLDKLDVAQSVIGDLLPRLPDLCFRTRAEFCAYLMNKMRWKASDRGRQHVAAKRREQRVAEGEVGHERADVPQPVEQLIEVEEHRHMHSVLDQLSPREQSILRLHLAGRTPKQIAESLSVSRDAVYKTLQRATARARLLG
jgi:RNA polymerase sigma factor (sigma-70 family)